MCLRIFPVDIVERLCVDDGNDHHPYLPDDGEKADERPPTAAAEIVVAAYGRGEEGVEYQHAGEREEDASRGIENEMFPPAEQGGEAEEVEQIGGQDGIDEHKGVLNAAGAAVEAEQVEEFFHEEKTLFIRTRGFRALGAVRRGHFRPTLATRFRPGTRGRGR